MGKAQSKLSSEELAELQKNTYCESLFPWSTEAVPQSEASSPSVSVSTAVSAVGGIEREVEIYRYKLA
jgi:hypothetical protein